MPLPIAALPLAKIDDFHLKSAILLKICPPRITGRKMASGTPKIPPHSTCSDQNFVGSCPRRRRVHLVIDENQSSYPALPKAILCTPLLTSGGKSQFPGVAPLRRVIFGKLEKLENRKRKPRRIKDRSQGPKGNFNELLANVTYKCLAECHP